MTLTAAFIYGSDNIAETEHFVLQKIPERLDYTAAKSCLIKQHGSVEK